MSRPFICFLSASIFAGNLFAASPAPAPKSEVSTFRPTPDQILPGKRIVNRVAATVNGRVVTTNELSFALAPIVAQFSIQYPRRGPEFVRQITLAKDKILNDLIDRELLIAEFESMGAVMKEVYIDEEVARGIRDMHGGSKEKLMEDLARAKMTMRSFRELTRRRMIVQAMRASRYDQGLPPTPKEIQEEYARSKESLRDMAQDKIVFEKIFLPIDLDAAKTNPQEAADLQLSLAEVLLEKLKKGANFAELAKTYSRDSHAADGGKWPELLRSQLSPEFSKVIFDAEENKFIGPLADPQGFTLVRVLKKTLAPSPPLEKVKTKIDDAVRRRKSAERYEKWISRLRENAIIRKRV